jgi:hypothetical protein
MCVVAILALGSTGCGDKKDKTKSPTTTGGAPPTAKQDVKIKEMKDVKLAKKKDDNKVTITIEDKAPEELSVTIKGDKISGAGKIAKDATSGEITVKTENTSAKEFTVEIAETAKTTSAKITATTKIE